MEILRTMDERLERRNSSKEFDSSVQSSPYNAGSRPADDYDVGEIPAAKVCFYDFFKTK